MTTILVPAMALAWRPRVNKATAGQVQSASASQVLASQPRALFFCSGRMQCIINHASQGAVNLMRKCERRLRAERPIGSQPRH